MLKVGITGGIGSGKSTVARLLELLGAKVYYADSRAKSLMLCDPELRRRIAERFGDACYRCEAGEPVLDRSYLAAQAFGDSQALADLNALVHPAVAQDFLHWAAQVESIHPDLPYVAEEAAVLIESGSYRNMDRIVVVTAPEPVRVARVMQRDVSPQEAVRARMAAQMPEAERLSYADFVITADERQLVIPQVLALHEALLREI